MEFVVISELQQRPETSESDTTDVEHFHFSPHGGFSEPPELLTDSYWGLKGKEKSANMVIMLIQSD